MSESFDWGIPPQQQPVEPVAAKGASLKKPLMVVLGVVAVVALSFGGLAIYQKIRPTPANDLGWDDAKVASYFAAGKLQACDLGEEFYASVGVSGVEMPSEQGPC